MKCFVHKERVVGCVVACVLGGLFFASHVQQLPERGELVIGNTALIDPTPSPRVWCANSGTFSHPCLVQNELLVNDIARVSVGFARYQVTNFVSGSVWASVRCEKRFEPEQPALRFNNNNVVLHISKDFSWVRLGNLTDAGTIVLQFFGAKKGHRCYVKHLAIVQEGTPSEDLLPQCASAQNTEVVHDQNTEPRSTNAIATLVSDDGDYVLLAMTLAKSIELTHVVADRVAMITPRLSECSKSALRSVGWKLFVMDPIANPFPNECGRFCETYIKFRLWQLPYSRVVFLDADTLVRKPIDTLFTTPLGEFGLLAVDHCSHADTSDTINSGVFVLRPSEKVFNAIMEASGKIERQFFFDDQPFRRGDQTLLHFFFQGCSNLVWPDGEGCSSNMTKLPLAYNFAWTCAADTADHERARRARGKPGGDNSSTAAIIHFASKFKPLSCVGTAPSPRCANYSPLLVDFFLYVWRELQRSLGMLDNNSSEFL